MRSWEWKGEKSAFSVPCIQCMWRLMPSVLLTFDRVLGLSSTSPASGHFSVGTETFGDHEPFQTDKNYKIILAVIDLQNFLNNAVW